MSYLCVCLRHAISVKGNQGIGYRARYGVTYFFKGGAKGRSNSGTDFFKKYLNYEIAFPSQYLSLNQHDLSGCSLPD